MAKCVDFELWVRLLMQSLWAVIHFFFTTIQQVVWLFNGTHRRIINNRLPPNYQYSAQVLDIVGRFRFSEICMSKQPFEFLTLHNCFDSPERVLQDHVSLYEVTHDEATFVETLPGRELWRSRYCPFFGPAQFRHAVHVIRMPISSFHRLADQLGDPDNVTFVCGLGRSGSTLVTQMFEKSEEAVAMSEPPALDTVAMSGARDGLPENLDESLIVSSVRLLCKPAVTRPKKGHVIKVPTVEMYFPKLLMSLFPKAHYLYLYRDGLKVSQSCCSLLDLLIARLIYNVIAGSTWRCWMVNNCLGVQVQPYQIRRSPHKYLLTTATNEWTNSQHYYRKYHEDGLPIVAIRYEDIVEDPETNMRRILRYCGLPEQSVVNSLRALEVDSQANTPMSDKNARFYTVPEYSGEAREEVDALCESYGLPPFSSGPYVAPGTITTSGDTSFST